MTVKKKTEAIMEYCHRHDELDCPFCPMGAYWEELADWVCTVGRGLASDGRVEKAYQNYVDAKLIEED